MSRERNPCVYILSSRPRGTLYIGVTSNLEGRLWQHREEVTRGFTSRHQIKRLVWFELHADMLTAIAREKQLKNWHRPWKVNRIETTNPQWADLAESFGFAPLAPRERKDGP